MTPLQFAPCGNSPQPWVLLPAAGGLSQLQQAAAADGGCLSGASASPSGPLSAAPCNASDPSQLWWWNTTAVPNVRPLHSRGFALAPAASACTAGGAGSPYGCCLTDNGDGAVAALWGCCPYTPSDCTNQRFELRADGSVRALRSGRCLGAAAPAPAPAPVASFSVLGALDYEIYESTPLVFGGRRLLMETVSLAYPRHEGHWEPGLLANCSSYFRVRDLTDGRVVVNLTRAGTGGGGGGGLVDSCNHSFGSAFVDRRADGSEKLWIFGSAWWRPVAPPPPPPAVRGGGLRDKLGWSGRCASDATCTVDSFATTDPALQQWSAATALVPGRQTWNVDVTRGRFPPEHVNSSSSSSSSSSNNNSSVYVMAAEQQPLPGAPAGSSWTTYFYTNSNADGDLTHGWAALAPHPAHVLGGSGTHGACPSVRYFDGWWYVVSGGLSVYLDRSRNLSQPWQPCANAGGVTLQANPAVDAAATVRWYSPTPAEAALLGDPVPWDTDASDVDFADMPDGTTAFSFLFGNQNNHIFSGLGTFNGSSAQWLAAQFASGGGRDTR